MGAAPLRTTTSLRSRFQCIAWGLVPTFVQRVGDGPGTSPTDPDAKALVIYAMLAEMRDFMAPRCRTNKP